MRRIRSISLSRIFLSVVILLGKRKQEGSFPDFGVNMIFFWMKIETENDELKKSLNLYLFDT